MNIGYKIKKLRIDHGFTQEQLADKLHVTRNAVSKWETDKGLPNIDSMIGLTKIFNISMDMLLTEEDVVQITLENKDQLEFNKNLLYSLILFITYSIIGIFIPHFSFQADPTSGIAVFAILLPICYILLGVVSVLISAKWPYVIISSALALTPIYFYFDSLSTTILGFWGILYFLLFIGTYFIISKFAMTKIKQKNSSHFKKIFFILFVIILTAYVIQTSIEMITLYHCIICSAPWYTALVVNTLIYIIPITITLTLTLYFSIQEKHTRL